jgi:predicted RNase H-like HicB family nuclease
MMAMTTLTLAVVIHREDDLYVAECPEVGTVSQGTTIEEVVENLREATELYLEEFPLSTVSRSLLTTFEDPL